MSLEAQDVAVKCPNCGHVKLYNFPFSAMGDARIIVCRGCDVAFAARVEITVAALTHKLDNWILDTESGTPAPEFKVDWSALPDWVEWATADENGDVHAWDGKPEHEQDAWGWDYGSLDNVYVTTIDMTGLNWTECILRRPS